MPQRFDPREGARNLLVNAIGATQGDKVLLISEDASLGFYDALAPQCIMNVGKELGLSIEQFIIEHCDRLENAPPALMGAIGAVDHVIFMARLGDSIRFSPDINHRSVTMCYALDIGMLGSGYCTLPHPLMQTLYDMFSAELDQVSKWRFTCPDGTDLTGSQNVADLQSNQAETFTIKLFPLCAFRPISCKTANGQIAVNRWLIHTGNRHYEDSVLLPKSTVFLHLEEGKIVDIKGESADVEAVKSHYQRVSGLFEICPKTVHSWHAGFHPQAYYPFDALSDLDRWASVAFANPRYLHIHTCGDFAPGEICFSLFDQTVDFDGVQVWNKGKLTFFNRPDVRAIIQDYGADPAFFDQRMDIGVPYLGKA